MPLSALTMTQVGEMDFFWSSIEHLKFTLDNAHLGLKQAMATVNDYNPLMKDFPLSDLLSATELDRIKIALINIFTHLKKIRNTKYPIMRCLRLVEAISRDLSSQMLKVLGTRRFMHIMFDDFEKVGWIHSCIILYFDMLIVD